MLPDPRVLLSRLVVRKAHIHSHGEEDDAELFCSRARISREKEVGVSSRSIDPRFAGATSPINADTGAHYTTSPSYANYEPP